MATRIFDALVVGAGPAGSRTARDLALAGLDVGLLEEHREVGRPCHCSGLVSPRTLDLAEVEHDLVINEIRGAVIHSRHRSPVRVGAGRVQGYVVDRIELDRRLAAQATAAGAELIMPARFGSYRLVGGLGTSATDGHVAVTAVQDCVPVEFRTRLLVGADGAFSKVAQQIRGVRPLGFVAGLGAHADYAANPYDDHVELFLDDHAAPGWFGWTIPLGDGTSRIGTGSANGVKPHESLERLRAGFPESFGTARIRSRTGGTIALWEPTAMVADRVMLVGDAARQVKPTSGGGIHAALHAAELAARHAAVAFRGPSLSARALASYERDWHRTMGRELRRQHDLRRAFNRLDERRLEDLLDILEKDTLGRRVACDGDIDFPSTSLRRLAFRYPLLAARLATWPRFPTAWLG
jgi:digeranylgeranylglycerophospholipid reductase